MSSKTKIVVIQLKELIYTFLFVLLGILLVLLLIFMFLPKGSKDNQAAPTMNYVAGVYSSSLVINDNTIDVEVVVDEDHINSICLINLSEAVTTMYPLMQPALDDLTKQIYANQSLEGVTYSEDNKYTSMVLLDAIAEALDKAALSIE
ncbi:hypothetical protein C8E03_11340 [Lachnotalea glycerini]|jgi:uncharacterized protein with FMN-binding domain|uniref:FMN-binding protein n=1 Tax=Lachnotalea glycerini TaxID=1763509 RepID=A0A255III5_9FIRM|nr:hypothetical protein [Lachnotalea glycerini]PXV86255.1 hypothetical protein C8E03_11340 [Lachnotalea glycerini]RDY31572.1 hypothetical protein CG710_008900 [Lachnotalea glycerini]